MFQLDELVKAMQTLGGMAEEHLQGQHDQSTHGQRDGGDGGGTGLKLTKTRLNADEIATAHARIRDKIGQEAYQNLKVATNEWVTSSDSAHAVTLEYIASEKYGGEVHGAEGVLSKEQGEKALKDTRMGRTQAEKVFDAQYEHTQDVLKTQYPDGYIEVYRGVRNRKGTIPESGKVTVSMDALSSWTTDLNTARVFAIEGNKGRVIKTRVAIKDIWASHDTNPKMNQRGESEVVVMGRGKKTKAEVVP